MPLLVLLLSLAFAQDPVPLGLQRYALGGAVGRGVIGAAPILAVQPTMDLLGFPPQHNNASARVMARLFGVRDIGLGVLVAQSRQDPVALRRAFALNLLTDLGDAAVLSVPLVLDQGLDRPAGLGLGFALGGATFWSAGLWWLHQREGR